MDCKTCLATTLNDKLMTCRFMTMRFHGNPNPIGDKRFILLIKPNLIECSTSPRLSQMQIASQYVDLHLQD